MTDENTDTIDCQNKSETVRKHFKLNWWMLAAIILVASILSCVLAMVFNNYSLWSDRKFSNKIDKAIEKATAWVHDNEEDILRVKNAALIKMLQDCITLYPEGNFDVIHDKFMATPVKPACWKALIDPNFPIQKWELNQTIKNECIDNKWILYAMAPDKAGITPEQMEFLLPDKWNYWQLTHQLWALIHLRKIKPEMDNEELIEHLCNRITHKLTFEMTVADSYFQKIAFVLYAGCPEKIRRRWIERVIKNQGTDGGWNDRWLCFESIEHRKRPVFNKQPPSDQHATIQALWLLCQTKYRYPEHFGLN
ncbi:MAG: hypothetical protein JW806_01965 [Sedimentisphaerales bacterium]|nr:hypothetical protein [Sedimentisphaerales bacterium]